MSYFNVRVYGILVNRLGQVLISDEHEHGVDFSKFPGGGVELGEGSKEALRREYQEECAIDIEVLRHIHTTDDYVPSSFNDSQVLGIYYLVTAAEAALSTIEINKVIHVKENVTQLFRWVDLEDFKVEDLTFEMDRVAWSAFRSIQL